jgi:hypothetical protein
MKGGPYLEQLREGLAAVARINELERRLVALDAEVVALQLALADRDHRIKALQFEIVARAKSAEVYQRDGDF